MPNVVVIGTDLDREFEAVVVSSPLMVSATTTEDAALHVVETVAPDLVLLCPSQLDDGGIGLICSLLYAHPLLPIILIAEVPDPDLVRDVFAAGACGYVVRQQAAIDLPRAIEVVLSGGWYKSPAMQVTTLLRRRPNSAEFTLYPPPQ